MNCLFSSVYGLGNMEHGSYQKHKIHVHICDHYLSVI